MNKQISDPFQAIADPARRRILHLLSAGSMTISALAGNFDMSRPAVSKHIKILEQAGFVMIADIGRERYCTLSREGFSGLREWMDHFDSFWSEKLIALDKLMNEAE